MAVLALIAGAGAPLSARAGVAGDPRDRPYVSIVLNQALETERTRVDIPWTNPETGTKGVLTIERTWFKDAGTPCRDYTRTIERAGGSRSTVRGTGCRIGPAVWTVTETEGGKTPPATPGSPRRLEPPASATPPPPPTASAPPETARAAPPALPPAPPHAASTPPPADAGPASSGAASAESSPPESSPPESSPRESSPPETPSAAAPAMPDFTQPSKAEM
jgi:surface antigen